MSHEAILDALKNKFAEEKKPKPETKPPQSNPPKVYLHFYYSRLTSMPLEDRKAQNLKPRPSSGPQKQHPGPISTSTSGIS